MKKTTWTNRANRKVLKTLILKSQLRSVMNVSFTVWGTTCLFVKCVTPVASNFEVAFGVVLGKVLPCQPRLIILAKNF